MTVKRSSMQRVRDEAEALGLDIDVQQMEQSTRTAQEAAVACGCVVDQIIKSLIFERADNGELVLVMVSGAHNADLSHLEQHFGTSLDRADTRKVRKVTGFAIGGVAPIGHLSPIRCVMDRHLLSFETVWAAAGRPDAVFAVASTALRDAIEADVIDVA